MGACRLSHRSKSHEDGVGAGCQSLERCKCCSRVKNSTSTNLPFTCGSIKQRLLRRARLICMQGIHYGTPQANSLQLVKYYFEKYPEDASKVVLGIKGAYDIRTGPNGSPEGIRASVEEAVRVLDGTKTIDVFECARGDPNVPIETSVKALAELVKEGKIGGIGLSEVSADTIRKAYAIHPISAVEIELSLFTPDPISNGIADSCRERTYPWKKLESQEPSTDSVIDT